MVENVPMKFEVHFNLGKRGQKHLQSGAARELPEPGRIPRVARLMALAIRMDGLVRQGAVKDYAELARLGHVTRARVTQIMNLCLLAPDIQEAVLFQAPIMEGRDRIHLAELQPIAMEVDWEMQRKLWKDLNARHPKIQVNAS